MSIKLKRVIFFIKSNLIKLKQMLFQNDAKYRKDAFFNKFLILFNKVQVKELFDYK